MKMIFAIVHKEDEGFVVERLNKEHISVTKTFQYRWIYEKRKYHTDDWNRG